jgi:hypothetical protein
MRDYRKQGSQNRLFVLLAISIPTAAALVAAPGQAAKPPTADNLTIRAAPSPIVYNASTIISGKLTGKVKSSTTVTLVGNEAPYTGGYDRVATTTTDGSGNYRFTSVRPLLNTRYHVSTTGPKVTSADVLVQVRIKLVLRLSDSTPAKGQRVKFFGTAAPDHDGRLVYIQKRTSTGKWRTLARTALRDAGSEFSKFSRRMRVRRGATYRARVFHDSDHADGISRSKHATVH